MTSPRDDLLNAGFWHGAVDTAREILREHPDLPRNDLHVAAYVGDDEAVRRLVAADPAEVNAKGGPRNVEPLIYLAFSPLLRDDASRSDAFARAATALLDAGASPNAAFFDESHQPPECESVLYGAAGVAHNAALTKLLLDRGADPNDGEVPYHAPEGYDNGALHVLLESGKLTNESLGVMLLRKADWHDRDGLRLVLDHGADPNLTGRFNRTALHHSVLSDNSLPMIELLLEHGADPFIVARDLRHGGDFRPGRSTISLAARRGRADVLAAIERRGISLDLSGADRLIAACARGDMENANRIADGEPATIQEVRTDGGTLLAEFAGNDNAAGVDILLHLGIPVDAPYAGDPYYDVATDSTPLHVAAWRMSHDTVDVLIRHGANVNACDGKGRTPLMRAVSACVDSYWKGDRSPRIAKALIAAGASRAGVSIPTGYDAIDRLLA